jgi:hypothetical protein
MKDTIEIEVDEQQQCCTTRMETKTKNESKIKCNQSPMTTSSRTVRFVAGNIIFCWIEDGMLERAGSKIKSRTASQSIMTTTSDIIATTKSREKQERVSPTHHHHHDTCVAYISNIPFHHSLIDDDPYTVAPLAASTAIVTTETSFYIVGLRSISYYHNATRLTLSIFDEKEIGLSRSESTTSN